MANEILIFHLSRFGFADYAAGMIDNLPISNCRIFVSAFASVPIKRSCKKIKTYRNSVEFLISSIINLPLLLIYLLVLKTQKKAQVAYFLGFHPWDLPIILICKALKIKILYTVHDGVLHEGEQYFSHQVLQRACIKLADELIFLTEFMKNETIQQYHLKKPAFVVPHGPIKVSETILDREHSRQLRLLFLGRIGKYKGVELLVEAVCACDDEDWEKLTIAGKPLYAMNIPNHPKIQRIERWLSDQEIADLLQNHHVLVLPYKSATQSGVVTLGISSAIPIIATKVGGLPEQLSAEEAVWTNPDPQELKNAIALLSQQKEAYDNIKERLIIKNRNLSWAQAGSDTAQLLQRLCR